MKRRALVLIRPLVPGTHCLRISSISSISPVSLVLLVLIALLLCSAPPAWAAGPTMAQVVPGKPLTFPRDFGSHPDFRTEWWYATGWLNTPDGKPLGFQITFFRSATDHDPANPSAFAARQLIIGHAALADPVTGKLVHVEKTAREGFGLAGAAVGDTDVHIDDWRFKRDANGQYRVTLKSAKFDLTLTLEPTQPLLLQGQAGYSRKGPRAEQASYYYSEPQLAVTGSIRRLDQGGKAENVQPRAVSGTAWLDHEWSTSVLDENAAGWDWTGLNLDDGSALMAFQIRSRSGAKLWSHAVLRDVKGEVRSYGSDQVSFDTQRLWRSPRTNAVYPVATTIRIGTVSWSLTPLMEDQELDSRLSTGAVYWEGAVRVSRDGKAAGKGYLELTGYEKPLKL